MNQTLNNFKSILFPTKDRLPKCEPAPAPKPTPEPTKKKHLI